MSVIKFLVSRRAVGALLVAVAAGIVVAAAVAGGSDAPGNGPEIATLAKSGASFRGDVRTLPQLPPQAVARPERPDREEPVTRLDPSGEAAPVGSGTAPASISAPAPSATSFDGLHYAEDCNGSQCGQGHPPDTNGDVGPTYYVQTINVGVGIYDKSTGTRVAAFTFDQLMSQAHFGNLCDTDNYGDPIVLYDTFADRWIITDFAFKLDSRGNVVSPPGTYQCFAVSRSGDPVSGGWNFYSTPISDALGDYPKLGIWPDGLYMAANMYGLRANSGFKNVRVWSYNKAQMYAGSATAQVVSFNVPSKAQGVSVFALLPSNARAQAGTPPAGTPNYFASIWGYTNRVRIWKFHVDWSNTANSTFTGPTDSLTGSTWASAPSNVPEKDGWSLDTLQPRAMMQNQYSNIGGVESLWDSHTVQGSSSSQAAVRYYQVRVTGGTVASSATQAATWNPDANNRFMPSVAVDKLGDMAIGYSVSDASMYPAIRYAGRLAGDPLNTLSQTESSIIEGTGGQTHVFSDGSQDHRWGDYSAMTLDPDGCTFWYTSEYYVTNGGDHHTRIGHFKYPGCS
jgi:hypothetical protein